MSIRTIGDMGFIDYFKGPQHKAEAAKLLDELRALKAKHHLLETKAKEIGLLDLLSVQKMVHDETSLLETVKSQVAASLSELESARTNLQVIQKQILVADQTERDDLQSRINELSSQNNQLDDEVKLLDYRERNARAGYVYVISNIGAFGEGIYKIGMTRRLEPMERIDELGDASVPFRFDVHALVFSDDAPALEAKLHAHFAAGRLNKVNGRKEFFRADLNDIEAVIRANYDAVVEVVHTAPAEQYRESLKLAMPIESIQAFESLTAGA